MPNGEPVKFPTFPTQYTEREQERLRELEKQRKTLEEIYQAKFAPEVWAKTPLPEKAVRELLPPWLAPVVRVITPWEKGAWDYGFTPEQVQDYRFKLEEEYKELARQEKVTRLLPSIQSDLMIAALLGEPITDLTELLSDFPELKTDFTEEEIGYLSSLAQNLLHATPEDILSGKVFGYDPSQLPIIPEDIEAFAKEVHLDPRFILSTVAFSKDLQEIGAALQQAYPPAVEELEVDEGLRQKLLEYFKQRAIDLGITPEEGEPVQETIEKVHSKIAEEEGELLVLANDETGALTVVRKKTDNTLWYGEELIGRLENGQVVPVDFVSGEPLLSEEEQEAPIISFFSNLYKGLRLGVRQAWEGVQTALTVVLPRHISGIGAPATTLIPIPTVEQWKDPNELRKILPPDIYSLYQSYSRTLTPDEVIARMLERIDYFNKKIANVDAYVKGKFDESQARFQVWVEEHPEFIKPQYQQDPWEHPELLLDPGYYGYTIGSVAPPMVAAFSVGIATAIATRNPVAGAIAGAAVFTPLEMSSVYADMIANGAPPGQAADYATIVGTIIGAVEVVPGLIFLRAVAPAFMTIFRRNLTRELTRLVARGLTLRGILATGGKIEVAEVAEEVLQQAIQNAAVKTINENRSLVEGLTQSFIVAAIATVPFAAFGMGAQYYSMKTHLPKDTQDKIDTTAKKLKDAGLSEEHAEAAAFTQILETEKGRAEVEMAIEKAEEEIPALREFLLTYTSEEEWGLMTLLDGKPALEDRAVVLRGVGLPIKLASKAWADLTETEQKRLTGEIPVIKPKLPAVKAIPAKIQQLESTLEDVNSDIDAFSSSIPVQEERLAKMKIAMELPSEQMAQFGKIEDMKKSIVELEDRRTKLISMIKKLNKAAVPKVTLPAPEVIETGKEYSAAVYRGTRAGVAPVDEGLLGSGTYYTSNREYAETYGEVSTSTVTLKNPYVIKTEAEAAEIWDIAKGARQESLARGETPQQADEFAAKKIREVIEAKGHDGIIAQNLIAKGEEVVVFYPEKAVTEAEEVVAPEPEEPTVPEAMPEELVVPDPDVGRELLPDRRPRLKDWEDDQTDIEAAIKDNKAISDQIVLPKSIREARAKAERILEGLHSRLEGLEDEEEIKAVTGEFGELAKRSKIKREKLLTSHWGDLSPPDQRALTLAVIPDYSITFPIKKGETFDIIYFLEFLEEHTGLPFYHLFWRIKYSYDAGKAAQEKFLLRIGTDPTFTSIRKNREARGRVAMEINSRNPALGVQSPEGLTDEERFLADVLEGYYKEDEAKVSYLRFMRTSPTVEALKEEFPEAVEAGQETELALALELRNRGDLDGLYSFLEEMRWGVIREGYTHWRRAYPSIVPRRVRLGTTRGAGILMEREFLEVPDMGDALLDYASYKRGIEAQWSLEPELRVLRNFWPLIAKKFTNAGRVESSLMKWQKELQGIPVEWSLFDMIIRRVWRQAMSAVFLHPWMPFRNFHQAISFHPDRTELLKLVFESLPPSVEEQFRVYFDSSVSQLKSIRRDFLYAGERGYGGGEGVAGLPGLGWLTRLSDSLSLYAHSDNIPRWWSFKGSAVKAYKATQQYREDGDISKWLKNSGAMHLRRTERNHALQLLAQPSSDLALPGLRDVPSDVRVSAYIGHRVADITHFLYERAFRGIVEMGATGRTIYNLIVFPKGYFQRIYFQAEKVFGEEASWVEVRAGFKDILLLITVGVMISAWLKKVTGRPRRAYNPVDIVQWQLGGLLIGVGMDLTQMISDMIVVLDPTVDPEHKKDVLGRLPGELIRQADVLVPFYKNLVDSIEASTDTRNIDVQVLRQLRALIDKEYTPEEIEEIDRNLWEKIRKAVLAGEPPDPTKFQSIQAALLEAQARLGEMDARGKFYTLRDFAGDIRRQTKPLPDDMLTENYNFSDLVIFYKECEDSWEELYKIKSSPARLRQEWRKDHEEVEAMLLFWGMYSSSVFTRGSPEWFEVSSLLGVWFDLYEIDKRMHGEWADWTLPTR